MKAIVQAEYGAPGDVLALDTVDRPTAGDGEVLVRVHATSVAGDDWHLMRGLPYVARMESGLFRPKRSIPGQDVAGTVEAVGPNVTRFAPGDEVFGWTDGGAFAEYVAISAGALARKPGKLTFEQAAAVPIVGLTALQALRDRGRIQAGQRVLINGAAGGVGTFAVQIAKTFGTHVTGVCSTRNIDLVRSIGADDVINYTRDDFTRGTRRFDLILDMVGNRSLARIRRALTPDGTLVLVGGRGGRWFMGTDRMIRALLVSPFVGQRLVPHIHAKSLDDLVALRDMIEAGTVTPVVARQYALEEVPEAIRTFETWHSSGKVVITV